METLVVHTPDLEDGVGAKGDLGGSRRWVETGGHWGPDSVDCVVGFGGAGEGGRGGFSGDYVDVVLDCADSVGEAGKGHWLEDSEFFGGDGVGVGGGEDVDVGTVFLETACQVYVAAVGHDGAGVGRDHCVQRDLDVLGDLGGEGVEVQEVGLGLEIVHVLLLGVRADGVWNVLDCKVVS